MPTPDTNLYMQKGETPEAYNTRTEAYFASKENANSRWCWFADTTRTGLPVPAICLEISQKDYTKEHLQTKAKCQILLHAMMKQEEEKQP